MKREPSHLIQAELDGGLVSVNIKALQAKLQSREDLYDFLSQGSKPSDPSAHLAAQNPAGACLLHARHHERQEEGKLRVTSQFLFNKNADTIEDKDLPQRPIKDLYKSVCQRHPEFKEYFPHYES